MVLSVLSIWSTKSSATTVRSSQKRSDEPVEVLVNSVSEDNANVQQVDSVDASGSSTPISVQDTSGALAVPTPPSTERASTACQTEPAAEHLEPKDKSTIQARFSFRSLGFFNSPKLEITKEEDASERQNVKTAAKRDALPVFGRSADRRTTRNALAVQRLIVGPGAIAPANAKARPVSRTEMTRIKSELMKPKSANRLIARLRELPIPGTEVPHETTSDKAKVKGKAFDVTATTAPSTRNALPIHAVCLESTEADVQSKHFSKLSNQSVISSSLDALTSLFSELHIVDLLSAPDLGLGQPVDGPGLLAGAIPTAETIIDGASKLTPQLMALGYATGASILPDHSTLHPPTDRLSVLTYWWGLELCLPPPTLAHLAQAPNIAHQVINFLSALALMYNGVREVLPFVRYIGQFVDFEWAEIEKQDKGKGVVLAATWIMPAAMVPRPWDFPDAPTSGTGVGTGKGTLPAQPIVAPNVPLPTVVVTPPSVIKNPPSQEVSTK